MDKLRELHCDCWKPSIFFCFFKIIYLNKNSGQTKPTSRAIQVLLPNTMSGLIIDNMHHSRIPYAVSRIEKTLTTVDAMIMVPTQIIRATGPVWFVSNPPSWAVPPVMGRVVGQRIDCAFVEDGPTLAKSTCSDDSSIPSAPPSPRTSVAVSRSSSFCEAHLRMVPAYGWEDWKQPKPDWYPYWFTCEPEDSHSEISKLDGWSSHSDDSD